MDGLRLSAFSRCACAVLVAAAFATGRPVAGQSRDPAFDRHRDLSSERAAQTAAPRGSQANLPTNQPPSWSAALQHHGEQRIEYAYDLASRGAIHTAQHELIKVLAAVAQTLDTDQGTLRHIEALAAAQTALDEAADFLRAGPTGASPQSLKVIVAAHRTALLRQTDTRQLSPIVAMQHYYSHAVQQFVVAAGDQRVAAEALFGLGRVMAMMHEHPLTGETASPQLSEQKMLVYYQAAWAIDPRHYQAANEYGVLLARFGQWKQACQAFEYSVAQHAEPQNTRNLALAYKQLGSPELARQASDMSRSLSEQEGGLQSSSNHVAPAVEWVDFDTFVHSGSPAGWSSLAPQDQAKHDDDALGSAGPDTETRRQSTTTTPAQPAKSKSLISNKHLIRLREMFKKN